MSLISLLVAVIIIGLLVSLLLWGIDRIGLEEPFRKIAVALVVLLAVLLVLGIVFGGITVPVVRLP